MEVARCGFTWRDGWGTHECAAIIEHHGLKHRCLCDSFQRVESDDEIGHTGLVQEEGSESAK